MNKLIESQALVCHEEIPAKLTGRDIAVMSPALIELTEIFWKRIFA